MLVLFLCEWRVGVHSRRQCELESLLEAGHYHERKSAAAAMEEAGTEPSIKCPEGRVLLICNNNKQTNKNTNFRLVGIELWKMIFFLFYKSL